MISNIRQVESFDLLTQMNKKFSFYLESFLSHCSLKLTDFFFLEANVTRTNHIMWTMGTDFRYQYANSWFRQMDKLIHYVKKVFHLHKHS